MGEIPKFEILKNDSLLPPRDIFIPTFSVFYVAHILLFEMRLFEILGPYTSWRQTEKMDIGQFWL